MGGCIVVMELPSFCCPQVRSFAPHSIMKATEYPLVVLFGDDLALWCVFVMHHPTGVEKNGQQSLDVAADLPCFLYLGDDECFNREDWAFFSGLYP